MVSRGKRRSSQRTSSQRAKGTKGGGAGSGGPRDNGSSSPVTPPLNKKRLFDISIPKETRAKKAPRPQRCLSPKHNDAVVHENTGPCPGVREKSSSKVHPPPISNRRLQASETRKDASTRVTEVGRLHHPVAGVSTANTIPEESGSDDRDVYMVQREPLENSVFYKRYVSPESTEDDDPRNVARRVFSPTTPGNAQPQSPCGGRQIGSQGLENEEDVRSGGARDIPTRECCAFGEVGGLAVTREMLSSFHQELESKFTSEIHTLHEFVREKFRLLESLEGNIAQQLNEIRVVSLSGRATGSQSRPTPLAKYEAKLDTGTPHGDWVFNVETISRVFRVNLCMFIVGLASETGDTLHNISLALRAVLFGLLPSQKRAAFTSGVGRKHSNFRFIIVLNILYNVQQNVFNRFLSPGLSSDGENPQVVRMGEGNDDGVGQTVFDSSVIMQINQPKWLKAGFIRRRHVEEARARQESNTGEPDGNVEEPVATGKQKKSWLSVKEKPDAGDIARYGALKVYRYITTGLYQAREKARWVLFEELTYVMSVWETEQADVDQRTLKLQWGDESQGFADCDLAGVPRCISRKSDASKADEQNQFILAEFLSCHREMVLYITHDVKVRVAGGTSRQRRHMEVRQLRRAVNLFDVACKFCVVFTEQSVGEFSHLPFLGAHQDSLKCIYAVALMLRELVGLFMEESMEGGKFAIPQCGSRPRIECHEMSLEYLMPAASVRKRLLASRCLRMSIDDFNKVHMRFGDEMGCTLRQSSAETDEEQIDARDDGVMLL